MPDWDAVHVCDCVAVDDCVGDAVMEEVSDIAWLEVCDGDAR